MSFATQTVLACHRFSDLIQEKRVTENSIVKIPRIHENSKSENQIFSVEKDTRKRMETTAKGGIQNLEPL
jgi:hypothetical protein